MTMYQYLQQVGAALTDKDGQALAELLSIKHSHALSPRLQVEDSESIVERELQSAFDDVVISHTRCLWAISEKNFCEAYVCQTGMVQVFTKVFQAQKDENWALPVMHTLCLDLHTLAVCAERQASQQGKGTAGEMLEKAADLLMALFRVCASDNRTLPEDSKRKGMLHLVNQLFKIYFRINKLHLCKPLVRAIDSSNIKDQFAIAQLVTYKYYVGRKAMFDSDFVNAEDFLTFAFERCYKKSRKNKRLILIYLIPVKMILGKLPQWQLLKKYDLLQFEDVVKAVREGNLQKLAAAMADNESFFIHCGIYLILEKLKIIAYRNLFKKVHLLLKTHQIPIDAFLVALKYMGEDDVDLDEVECILGNLIYEGKVKGYISHQHRKLVVSKQNPFPPLSTVL